MPLNIQDFAAVAARASRIGTRDIVVDDQQNAQQVGFGRFGRVTVRAADKELNKSTMEAFRAAMVREYGILGDRAFEQVVGGRSEDGKSLRARDVRATIASLSALKVNELRCETLRLVTTLPELLRYSPESRADLARMVVSEARNRLGEVWTAEEISDLAAGILRVKAVQNPEIFGVPNPTDDDINAAPANARAPMGLSYLKARRAAGLHQVSLIGPTTSVEDRMKRKTLYVGQRIDNTRGSPMLLAQLKKNGVEPGFIYTHDWSERDSLGLLADTGSAAVIGELTRAAGNAPAGSKPALALAAYNAIDGQNLANAVAKAQALENLAFALGQTRKETVAFAAEYVIRLAAATGGAPNAPAALRRLHDVLPQNLGDILPNCGEQPTQAQKAALQTFKQTHFSALRDAVMKGGLNADLYADSPLFRHFSDRHIVKLDYNEGDRDLLTQAFRSAGKGNLRLPDRVAKKKGVFFRAFRLTTAEKASAGAAAEALANDLTRMLGVPAQELSVIRGEYSDGTPKLMLSAKFATGYRDMDGNYLMSGRIVPQHNNPAAEVIGRYKAAFLLLADRDAVGSHGQNKGFLADGTFFAIDPGHSLEGNGRYLDIKDNFSFRDTKWITAEKRFDNYSVFDDCTRFEKFRGILDIRALAQGTAVSDLFREYRTVFRPRNSQPLEEQSLCIAIQKRVDEMEAEFTAQMNKLLTVFGPQLAAYDALQDQPDAVREGAIEMIENLEKFTSPVTAFSEDGQVALNHLEVRPDTRIPWSVRHDAAPNRALVYTSSIPVSAASRQALQTALANTGAVYAADSGGRVTVTVPIDSAGAVFGQFDEVAVNAARVANPMRGDVLTVTNGPQPAIVTVRPAPAPGQNPATVLPQPPQTGVVAGGTTALTDIADDDGVAATTTTTPPAATMTTTPPAATTTAMPQPEV